MAARLMRLVLAGVVVLAAGLSGCAAPERPAPPPPAPPPQVILQAVPIRNFFRAIETEDPALFNSVFSERKAREKANRGWDEELATYVSFLGSRKGDAAAERYEYGYDGDAESGHVIVTDDGNELWRASVTFEAGEWKLDEN